MNQDAPRLRVRVAASESRDLIFARPTTTARHFNTVLGHLFLPTTFDSLRLPILCTP